MKIIGGLVAYEDGIKGAEQFAPPRKVRVELSFSLDESGDDADAAIGAVLGKARLFVQRELGLSKPTAAAKAEVKPPEPKPEPKAEAPVSDKAKLAAAAGLPADGELTPSTAAPKPPRAPAKPKPAPAVEELTPSTEAPADDLGDLLDGEPKEVTDADLNDACQKAMVRINTPENPGGPRIRELSLKYIPEGKTGLRTIPQDKRAEFLVALKELK